MPKKHAPLRWPGKVSRTLVRRVYASVSQGLFDDHLIDELGIALLVRCEALLHVSCGEAVCPLCNTVFQCITASSSSSRSDKIPVRGVTARGRKTAAQPCPQCGWRTNRAQYKNSYTQGGLGGFRGIPAFGAFVRSYPAARTVREKMLLIDRLIHEFHHQLKRQGDGSDATPTSVAAANLIEGRDKAVVEFLGNLTYGSATPGEMRRTRGEYNDKLVQMQAAKEKRQRDWRLAEERKNAARARRGED